MFSSQVVVGISVVVFSLVVLFVFIPHQVPPGAETEALTPAFFPRLASGIILLLGLIYAAGGIRKGTEKQPVVLKKKDAVNDISLFRVTGAVLSMFVYTVALGYLGFVIASVLLLAFLSFFLGARRWMMILLFSSGLTMAAYYLFSHTVQVPLPQGIWGF